MSATSNNRAVTYGLMAFLFSNIELFKTSSEIFKPLVKRALSKMCLVGVTSGKSIIEIKKYLDELYSITFPLPVITSILQEIARDVGEDGKASLRLHEDKSFIIDGYSFLDIEDEFQKQEIKVEGIEKLFEAFCLSQNRSDLVDGGVFEFVNANKISIGRYLSATIKDQKKDNTIFAEFVSFFRGFPDIYGAIENIYLGSIVSSYLEYTPKDAKINTELLFDTNFILGLLNLNTEESKDSCETLINISRSMGFKFSILNRTIEEIENLLDRKVEEFDTSFLQSRVNQEDVLNACHRRNLNKADLFGIRQRIKDLLRENGISTVFKDTAYENKIRKTSEYKELLLRRNNIDKAALVDACAIYYVRERRNNETIKSFENAKCWFVNNSCHMQDRSVRNQNIMPENIKVDDLVNILWLSCPNIQQNYTPQFIARVGLATMVSISISESLPKTSIIRELDDNICKYANGEISDTEAVLISTRIASRRVPNVEDISKTAESNKEEFVKRLKEIAREQKEENERFFESVNTLMQTIASEKVQLAADRDRAIEEKMNAEKESTNLRSEIEGLKRILEEYKETTQLSISRERQNSDLAILEERKNYDKVANILNEENRRKHLFWWRIWPVVGFIISILTLVVTFSIITHVWEFNPLKEVYQRAIANKLGVLFMTLELGAIGATYKFVYHRCFDPSKINAFKAGIKDVA